MTDADIDRLQKRVDSLCREIDNAVALKARHRVIVEHDDGNGNGDDDGDYGDGDSNPSMDASEADDDEDNGNPGNDVDDDDDDEDAEEEFSKAESIGQLLQSNDPTNRPGALRSERHSSPGHTTAPPPALTRTKFDAQVERIMREENMNRTRAWDRVSSFAKRANDIGAMFEGTAEHNWCDDNSLSRTEALRKARLENRKLFRRYQRG
jgi:hypothetical protein